MTSAATNPPLSSTPISPSTSTSHNPTTSTSSNPIHTSQPPINPEPAELDSTPISPVGRNAAVSQAGSDAAAGAPGGRPDTHGTGFEEMTEGSGREKWAQLLEQRKKDPAVLVDIPGTPTAGELALKLAEGEEKGAGEGKA
ncbi:hypothetical protein P152DRAFT_479448 [Eremomyces bilateralis CBS 781.70]|uniref:Uncharacterized protein n=1 Tax=Eremomyces bilateralis CBS 781.70 TaxID=1392243 RepID=A0A6G1GBR2_9PEZI|nr:uncharacterized protein P152DRAFT_479448 [Eremomyces bilateralis CBS 781.70]KAF1815525.1 hypothetical protein P152DRAFT_479448 [Eremomyces bilateralis CBS 781.70]